MRRTQIYLTETERTALQATARRLGQSQSEVIRAAVDRYLEQHQSKNRLEMLRQARGLWRNRCELPDFRAIRRELDRSHP